MRPGSLAHLVLGSMRTNRFSTVITVFLTALSLGLSLSTLALRSQAREAFLNGSGGYDAVLGAKGSPLQLVLNALYHLETSPGNIPWHLYQEVKDKPGVRRAYPLALGDSFAGFRVIGTVPGLIVDPPEDKPAFADGGVFDPGRREAVVGSEAARRSGLRVGVSFRPTHGLAAGGHDHAEEYLVVGELAPTNGPMDRAIYIPLEGVLRLDGHVLRDEHGQEYRAHAGQAIPPEHWQLSAVLLDIESPQRGLELSGRINRGSEATMAYPVGQQVSEIFDKLGWAHHLLSLFAVITLVISAGAILASLSVASELRRRDYALLRTLGLPRWRLGALLVVEGVLTVGLGALLALPLTALFSLAAADWVRNATGVTLRVTQLAPEAPILLLLALLLGALAGAVPGWRVYGKGLSGQLDPEGEGE